MFKKTISIICGLILLGGIVLLAGAIKTKAQADGVALHIKTEISGDNGQTWLNYGGSESHNYETLCPNPGENTFLVRTKIWNTGQNPARNVTGTSTLTSSYRNCDNSTYEVNTDSDGDQTHFTNSFFTSGNVGTIANVPANGSENDVYEGQITGIRTCPNYNPCDYPITGTATLANYMVLGKLPNLIGRAFATGNGYQSTFQIGGSSCRVCGTSTSRATTTTSTTTSTTTATTSLPSTGTGNLLKSLLNLKF